MEMLSAFSGANEFSWSRAPRRSLFSLNFSIQLVLGTVRFSGVVVVEDNTRACSWIMPLVNRRPFFSCNRSQSYDAMQCDTSGQPGSSSRQSERARCQETALSLA